MHTLFSFFSALSVVRPKPKTEGKNLYRTGQRQRERETERQTDRKRERERERERKRDRVVRVRIVFFCFKPGVCIVLEVKKQVRKQMRRRESR